MKPQRLCLTHNLVLHYGLYKKMDVYRPRRATAEELQAFHADTTTSSFCRGPKKKNK